MRNAIVTGCLLSMLAACGGPTAAAPPPQAAQDIALPPLSVTQTRVYTGQDGLKIEVVDLSGEEALLQVSGVSSPLAGLVLRYKRQPNGRDLAYQTRWHGRTWNVLLRSESYGRTRWQAYIPESGQRDGFELKYSEELSPTVAVDKIHRTHLEQTQAGKLEAAQRFDRVAEEAGQIASFEESAKRTSETCGAPIAANIAWETVSDAQLLEKSVSGYCDSVLSGLRSVCRFGAGKQWVAEHASRVTCRLDGQGTMTSPADGLTWAINFDLYNLDEKARETLFAVEVSPGRSLAQAIQDEQTVICADETFAHYVMVGPNEAAHGGMAYGDGTNFVQVRTPKMLGDGWFFEPRMRNDKNNSSFRGYDLRFYSHVNVDPAKLDAGCTVTCGSREVNLSVVSSETKAAVLARAKYAPSKQEREPYALARDTSGMYFLVDRGATEATEKDFRLYRGMRGRLKPLKMKDVVSDSEGEIFASSGGKLRLLVGREDAQWVSSGKTSKLKRLPIQENYGLIYNELGVYLAKQLGNPCDDL